jgi:hypothetical protein
MAAPASRHPMRSHARRPAPLVGKRRCPRRTRISTPARFIRQEMPVLTANYARSGRHPRQLCGGGALKRTHLFPTYVTRPDSGVSEPRVRIPSNGFWLASLISPNRQPRSRGVSQTPRHGAARVNAQRPRRFVLQKDSTF